MEATIRDQKALLAISPAALSAYARSAGWTRTERYREHSDVYVGEALPEIVLPRTDRLGDYASVVSTLIGIFAEVANLDELALYRDLVTTDRDVIRVRAAESEDGSVNASAGVSLMRGAHDMLLAAACSLRKPQPLYRAGANREASDYLKRVRLGQTEQGSFAITLLSPVVSPPMRQEFDEPADEPIERLATIRLADALTAAREATERVVSGDDGGAFRESIERGVSANMCEALAEVIEPFQMLDISLIWARTRPIEPARKVIRFAEADASILREAARSFRDREPRPDEKLFGRIRELKRDEGETSGTVTLLTSIEEGQTRSVKAFLKQSDYEQAISAHKDRIPVVMEGDLERRGRSWSLFNSRIVSILADKDVPNEDE